MPKHEGGRPEITCTKTEQVIQEDTPTYTELGLIERTLPGGKR